MSPRSPVQKQQTRELISAELRRKTSKQTKTQQFVWRGDVTPTPQPRRAPPVDRTSRPGERSELIIPTQSVLTSLNFLLRQYRSRLLVTTKDEEPNSTRPRPHPSPLFYTTPPSRPFPPLGNISDSRLIVTCCPCCRLLRGSLSVLDFRRSIIMHWHTSL